MADAVLPPTGSSTAGLDDVHARLAIEAAGLGLWEWDIDADLVSINHILADLLGRPDLFATPFAAQVLTDLTHVDDRDKVTASIQRCMSQSEGVFFVEHRIHRPDGQERWLWIRASTVQRDPSGRSLKIVGVVQDRTDAKLAELELEREKLRNDLALAGSLIAVWEWDIETDEVRWSSYLSEILGLPTTLLSGDRGFLRKRIHADDAEATRKATTAHLRQGRPYDVEFRLRHEAGHYITVRSRGKSVHNEAGRVVRVAGSLVDITKERESETTLRRLGLRSQLAVEAARLGTWELDLVAGQAVMDARLSNLLGRSDLAGKPIAGTSMLDFTAPEDRDIVRGLFSALIKGESEFVHNEHRVLHADGHRVWIFAHVGVAERTPDGRAIRLVGVTQDLSEQKTTEQALRTAKDRAEAANAAKSDFLATMSHEIRTPLNGILGVAQLLALSGLDDRQRRYVDTLQSSGRMLTSVIDDILDISRIEAGKLTLSLESVDTAAWLEETLAPFHPMAAQKRLRLTCSPADTACTMRRFDPRRTAQIIGNLVSNAIKFTDTGSVCVTLTCPDMETLRFGVADTGPGISEDKRLKVFDRFTQGDMSPSREHGGSGLGLAISRELTELAGGRIGLHSTAGEGATFWFEIPAPQTVDEASPNALEAHFSDAIERRALIVEDNAINRETLAEMLSRTGIEAEAVSSGEAALDRLASGTFDLVLLDLHMPGMGGFETLQAIRCSQTLPNAIPVLLVSADVTPEARQQAGKLGAQDFLTKPLDMAALINAIDSLEPRQKDQ